MRRSLSKARHQYFTFLTSGGVQQVLAYLNDRLAKGDSLNASSPVIAPDIDHSYGRGYEMYGKPTMIKSGAF